MRQDPSHCWSEHPTITLPHYAIAAVAYRIAEFLDDELAFEDPVQCVDRLTDAQATWLLRVYFPWLLWPTYQGNKSTQERLAKGIEDLAKNLMTPRASDVRQNPWSRRHELAVGQREEMEHTKSPRIARRIAEDHLREDPDYYEKLQRCGLVKPPRRNPSIDVLRAIHANDAAWYKDFHGVEPSKVHEVHGWVPGGMVLLGEVQDVGYKIKEPRSEKEAHQPYVHETEGGVKVYRRARSGEKATRTWKNFPTTLRELGYNIGFSYADKNGDIHEVKGSNRKYLAVTPSSKTLVVVGPSGVEHVIEGGKLHVVDWIRG